MGCFESRERVLEEVGPLDDPHIEAPIPRHPRTEVLSVRALLQVLCLHESPTLRERPLTRWAHIRTISSLGDYQRRVVGTYSL